MYRTRLSLLFLITAIFSLMSVGTLAAQADDGTVVEPITGYEFSLPAGWDLDYNDDDAAYFYNDDYTLDFDFYLPEDLEERDIPADDLLGATEAVFYTTDTSITFADVEAEIFEEDDVELALIDYTDTVDGEDYPVAFVTFYLADGSFIYGRLYPESGSDPIPDVAVADSLSILSSLQAVASDDVTVVEPIDGYEFSLPAGWDFDYNEDNFAYFFNDDYTLDFDFYLPEDLEEQDIPADDLLGATEAIFYTDDASIIFADVEAEIIEVDGGEIVLVEFTDNADDEDFPVAFITLYLPDGTFIYGKVYPEVSTDPIPDAILDDALFILTSLQVVAT